MAEGIEPRHHRECPATKSGRCNCQPSYRAAIYDARTHKRTRKTFTTLAAAKAWRSDALREQRLGLRRGPTTRTVREAGDELIAGMRNGSVRNRSGAIYKPVVVVDYEEILRERVVPVLGKARLHELARPDVQKLIDQLLSRGLSASTVRNAIMPLRVIYRRAIARGEVATNPTTGVEIPAGGRRRERVADPTEAAQLIAALDSGDRAYWATAMYAGLRRGELAALAWEQVDLAGGIIRVERAYDHKTRQFIEPKSRAGRRRVPIVPTLREFLIDLKLTNGRTVGLVFGRDGERPIDPSSTRVRARAAWDDAGLLPMGLHEARHTFASLMIAAGVGPKALQSYMGHSSIRMTYDLYGHLLPGGEAEAADLLQGLLDRA